MPTIDCSADHVQWSSDTGTRLATFNVEHIFFRPISMDCEGYKKGQAFLDAFHELNSVLSKAKYADDDKPRTLEQMTEKDPIRVRSRGYAAFIQA